MATPTWQGSASDAKWSSSANWTEPITVGGSVTTELEFGGTTNLSPHVDNPWAVKSFLFRPQAGSFEIIGKALTFADAALVQNNSPENQFIKNAKVVLSGASTWATSYGNIEVTGVISGAGSLTKTGTITLGVGGGTAGFTSITGGTLALGVDGALSSGKPLIVNATSSGVDATI